jgi:cytochrome bd-type quinol oxidase subunit 2
MAREPLRPEDATSWDDFLDRIAEERSVRHDSRESIGLLHWVMAGTLLFVGMMVVFSDTTDRHGLWWQWPAALAALAIFIRMAIAAVQAVQRAERDAERLKELDLLELGWKSHLERPRH